MAGREGRDLGLRLSKVNGQLAMGYQPENSLLPTHNSPFALAHSQKKSAEVVASADFFYIR